MCCGDESDADAETALRQAVERFAGYEYDPLAAADAETMHFTVLLACLRYATFEELVAAAGRLGRRADGSAPADGPAQLCRALGLDDADVLREALLPGGVPTAVPAPDGAQALAGVLPYGLVVLRLPAEGPPWFALGRPLRPAVAVGRGRLDAASFAAAVRAGRTVVTNGPWITLAVDGTAPGGRLVRSAGTRLTVSASVTAAPPGTLWIRDVDGPVASATVVDGAATVTLTVRPQRATWYVAGMLGDPDPAVLAPYPFAHTSAVHVDVPGTVAHRPHHLRWCLDWIDRLEVHVRRHGRLRDSGQLDDHVRLYDRARAVYRDRLAAHVR